MQNICGRVWSQVGLDDCEIASYVAARARRYLVDRGASLVQFRDLLLHMIQKGIQV
jgi:hypothetical protein